MHDLVRTMSGLGRRLTDAGREARQASTAVGKEVIDQLTSAIGSATGEVVRAAVIGAVAAIIRVSPERRRTTTVDRSLGRPRRIRDRGDRQRRRRPPERPMRQGGPHVVGRPGWVGGMRERSVRP